MTPGNLVSPGFRTLLISSIKIKNKKIYDNGTITTDNYISRESVGIVVCTTNEFTAGEPSRVLFIVVPTGMGWCHPTNFISINDQVP
jgi:hypothetical protein